MDGSFLGRGGSSLDRSTAGTKAQRAGRYEFGAPAALIRRHGLVRRARIAMAPADREANLLIAMAAPASASAGPPLGAAEAGASAASCTGSRHCSPRSTLDSSGTHRMSHAPRPSGFLCFLKYSGTAMPIDLATPFAFEKPRRPEHP